MDEYKTEFESSEQTANTPMIPERRPGFPRRHGHVNRICGALSFHGLENEIEAHTEFELDRDKLVIVNGDKIDAPNLSAHLISEASQIICDGIVKIALRGLDHSSPRSVIPVSYVGA